MIKTKQASTGSDHDEVLLQGLFLLNAHSTHRMYRWILIFFLFFFLRLSSYWNIYSVQVEVTICLYVCLSCVCAFHLTVREYECTHYSSIMMTFFHMMLEGAELISSNQQILIASVYHALVWGEWEICPNLRWHNHCSGWMKICHGKYIPNTAHSLVVHHLSHKICRSSYRWDCLRWSFNGFWFQYKWKVYADLYSISKIRFLFTTRFSIDYASNKYANVFHLIWLNMRLYVMKIDEKKKINDWNWFNKSLVILALEFASNVPKMSIRVSLQKWTCIWLELHIDCCSKNLIKIN